MNNDRTVFQVVIARVAFGIISFLDKYCAVCSEFSFNQNNLQKSATACKNLHCAVLHSLHKHCTLAQKQFKNLKVIEYDPMPCLVLHTKSTHQLNGLHMLSLYYNCS